MVSDMLNRLVTYYIPPRFHANRDAFTHTTMLYISIMAGCIWFSLDKINEHLDYLSIIQKM